MKARKLGELTLLASLALLLALLVPGGAPPPAAALAQPAVALTASDRAYMSTVVFSDDFSTDPNANGLWNIHRTRDDLDNEASWDSENQVLYLTRAVGHRGVAMFANYSLDTKYWQASFRYRAGGSGDGFVFMFYKDAGAYGQPSDGGGLGFMIESSPPTPISGYGIEFDSWRNPGEDFGDPECGDPSSAHIALVKDSNCEHLVFTNDGRVKDNAWHDVEIDFADGSLDVFVDGESAISYTLTAPDYTYTGVGFGAGTGAATSNQVIDDFVLHDREGGSIDIGFRPNSDGYSFPNYGGFYPLTSADYSIDEAIQMFGEVAACRMIGGVCFPKFGAITWIARVNRYMNGGHCDGMASTSLRLFKGLDDPADFQTGANTTHDLQKRNVQRHIAYYWVLCVPDPVASARDQALQNTPGQVLDKLRSAMSGGATDPTTLLIYNTDHTAGHAITPYAIDDQGNGVYWVLVYDNNHEDDANRHVVIDTTNDAWSYDLGSGLGTWSGDANTHSLGTIPISLYAQQPVCPWCSGTKMSSGAPTGQVWLTGQGHLLLTNVQGRRIGYSGDQFVNEVPGAFGSVPPGGLGIPQEPIYHLPLTDTYTLLLDGQTLTQTGTVAVTQFGQGYAVSVDDVILGPTSQDELTIAPDGTQLAYQPGDAKEATLTLALDGVGESNQFQVGGADVGAGQVVTLTVDVSNSQLVFNNVQAAGGAYDLEVTRVSTAGKQIFLHAGLVISATDTHYVDYGAWDGSGPMTVCTDHGSDGAIDNCAQVENQANRIYLPLVLRDY